MSEHRERRSRGDAEQRSENSGSLLGVLLTLVGIPVGWIGYVFSVLIVANHLMDTNLSPSVLSLSPTATFRLGVAVLVVVGFAMLVRPALVLGGWFVMAVLLAAGAMFVFGWSQLVLIVEGVTLAPLVLVVLIGLEDTADSSSSEWFFLGYLAGRRRRWRWRRW
jgi:cation transport ATPase